MRFYQQQHPFYCGVDLHANSMHICIVDQAGSVLVHRNLSARRDYFLNALAPYRQQGIVIGVECMFAWYWCASPPIFGSKRSSHIPLPVPGLL